MGPSPAIAVARTEPRPFGAALRRPALARNVVSNWISIFTALVYGFLITPLVVRALGDELYGVWSFLNGLLAYSDLLYFGLGASLIRRVAEHRATGNQEGLNLTASTTLSIYGLLGGGCLLATLLIAPLLPDLLPGSQCRSLCGRT